MVSFLESEMATREMIRARARSSGASSGRKVDLRFEPSEEAELDFNFFVTESTTSLDKDKLSTRSKTQRSASSVSLARASLKSSSVDESLAAEIDSVVLYSSITKAPAKKPASTAAKPVVAKAELDLGSNATETKSVSKVKPKKPSPATASAAVETHASRSFKSKSRSSTMPGFIKVEGLDEYVTARTTTRMTTTKRKVSRMSTSAKKKRRQLNSEALYKKSSSVPDSLLDYAQEIHAISRVSPKEEIELGTKTQEAIRLQKMYDDLRQKYGREPTDDEWCAAAGKINMEALKEALDAGNLAKNQLVASNLRMVQRVVNLYIRNGLGSEYNAGDLMQDGTMVSTTSFIYDVLHCIVTNCFLIITLPTGFDKSSREI